MGEKIRKCPDCGLDAKFIRYLCEEVMVPVALQRSDLERIPPFGELGRNFLVECPVHGNKIVQEIGHHITTIPKKHKRR